MRCELMHIFQGLDKQKEKKKDLRNKKKSTAISKVLKIRT